MFAVCILAHSMIIQNYTGDIFSSFFFLPTERPGVLESVTLRASIFLFRVLHFFGKREQMSPGKRS